MAVGDMLSNQEARDALHLSNRQRRCERHRLKVVILSHVIDVHRPTGCQFENHSERETRQFVRTECG